MIPIGFVAVIAGWVVTEVGRQPWTVYGLMRTADSCVALADWHECPDLIDRLHGRLSVLYPAGVFHVASRARVHRDPQHDAAVEGGRPIAPVLAGGRIGGSQ